MNGSTLYTVKISLAPINPIQWAEIIQECSGKIDSLVELLQGKFSKSVMGVMTSKEFGLFPSPNDITLECSCPDYAIMCKHVAAVMYGIGARIDHSPQDLFLLRDADHQDLLASVGSGAFSSSSDTRHDLLGDISELFGIDIDEEQHVSPQKEDAVAIPPKKRGRPKKMLAKNLDMIFITP